VVIGTLAGPAARCLSRSIIFADTAFFVMLFNSLPFIFGFFPVTVLVFFLVARKSHIMAAGWLASASLFFYGWWNAPYVLLLIASIAFNYGGGLWLARLVRTGQQGAAKTVLVFAICANLALLAYYKYANFFVHVAGDITGSTMSLGQIVLPLGISFFTFTQLAFVVDVYRGYAKEYNFVHYMLFVTYFPHLIAGPVLHHREMMPQFQQGKTYQANWEDIAVGLTIFFVGLFKKTVIADGIAPYATPLFASPGQPDLLAAWGGALAYTLQLYFDFSGYSDMAIGLSRVLGVKLPLNFNSPYKAVNMMDFWRRWHMTLSRFLRDYLYIPLGGNRRGPVRRYVNLLATMVVGGLWHGAGWTFIVWGTLHGLYLIVNHSWLALRGRLGHDVEHRSRAGAWAGRLVTFAAVVAAWVFFRASSFDDSIAILRGMAGVNGVSLPEGIVVYLGSWRDTLARIGVGSQLGGGSQLVLQYIWILTLLPVVLFAPNTQEMLARYAPALDFRDTGQTTRLLWSPNAAWGFFVALMTAGGLLSLSRVSEFLYYQF
jgi:alginate O-acetyltransferase complex protein AlgI